MKQDTICIHLDIKLYHYLLSVICFIVYHVMLCYVWYSYFVYIVLLFFHWFVGILGVGLVGLGLVGGRCRRWWFICRCCYFIFNQLITNIISSFILFVFSTFLANTHKVYPTDTIFLSFLLYVANYFKFLALQNINYTYI